MKKLKMEKLKMKKLSQNLKIKSINHDISQ